MFRAIEERITEFSTRYEQLRLEVANFALPELEMRLREVCSAAEVPFPEAEVQLFARLLKDERWPSKHPLRALVWAWQHRQSTSFHARLRQLRTRSFTFAG